jgi:archaemetzincin
VSSGGERNLPVETYNLQRGQYNADLIVNSLLQQKKHEFALWVIPQDLYTRNMNFIFGLALYYHGAVLSLFRLHTNELKEKEAIHEIGHVLGLPHCTNTCVMQYSNSLGEAQRKPLMLCEQCKRLLNI